MRRVRLARAILASTLLVGAVAAPAVGNEGAVLPLPVRSGEHVRWLPQDVRALVDSLRAEGAAVERATEIAQVVHSESRRIGVDPLYVLAVMKVESNFRADAVSPRGAVGLMQVHPIAARALARSGPVESRMRAARLRDPRTNVALGLRYLRSLEGEFGDRATVLAAYNLGPTRVRRHLERNEHVPREYSDRVLAAYRAFAADRAGIGNRFTSAAPG